MAALETLNRHINVKKTDRTFIVDIDVWSNDPAKAAMLANAISRAYLAESKNSQATAARRATTDLSGRLKELQERLRNAENTLATYKAQNNFVGTQDTMICDQQLSASNQRLAAARALTLDAQAKYDQIEASRRASTDAGAIPEALQSPTIANLRAQYAEARKQQAELTSELGPRHPALRQVEKQVEDLRRNISEEIDRFAQSARNDLTRARDYEASLNKALETQKRQSVQLSQASVRLRELEREVEASRDVYQSFLKRSRETEEQESLNTSSARIIGEATVPQRRTFPPAMSMIAIARLHARRARGFGLDHRGRPAVARDQRTAAGAFRAQQTGKTPAPPSRPVAAEQPRQQHRPAARRRGREAADRAPAGIRRGANARRNPQHRRHSRRGADGLADAARGLSADHLPQRHARHPRDRGAAFARRAMPVIAVIGAGASEDRSIAALNIALAAARDGASVLMIDADHATHAISNKVNGLGKSEPSRLGWLSIGTKASRAIKTANGISILPVIKGTDAKVGDAISKAIAQARSAGGYDLVILDGPAMPWSTADRKLLDFADGLVAILPVSLDINDAMEDIITALGGAERKLIGVVLSELQPTTVNRQRDQQYA